MKVTSPFARLTYEDALRRFGTDKPDLRYGMELADFTDLVAGSDFAVFRQVVEAGGQGLVSVGLLGQGPVEALTDEEVRSPVARFLNAELVKAMARRAGAGRGDLILMVADTEAVA